MEALICNQCERVSRIPDIDGYFSVVTGPPTVPSRWDFCGPACLALWAIGMRDATPQRKPAPPAPGGAA